MTKIEGRLHLCSRSLVFEPYENNRGIIRCPFAKMDGAPREYPNDTGYEAMCVEFISKKHFVMKENNVIGPFEVISVPARYQFTFLHSSPTSFVELCQRLFLMAAEAKTVPSHATSALDAMLKPMLDRPFSPDHLVDMREQVHPQVSNLRCSLLTPLQSKPGVLALTNERIYFQAACGILNATETRAMRWQQRDVAAIARRYNGLRDSALEIYWTDETSTLFAFDRRHAREEVIRNLPKGIPCFTDRDFVVQVHDEWKRGNIGNFEYLLALNSASGRSFHDLSRYPVFPWVIQDFKSAKLDLTKPESFRDLSKPIGALNPKRLEYFKARMHGMHDMGEPFLYGTHYSAPGYVLYYLIRSMPEHMLCLQNGKFDAPDRMFHSIEHCFNCCMTNHADVKELIPEFFNAGNDFDFLINARGLQLGATQNGDRVDDVHLPPWAKSARDFVKKNRKGLESDHVTRMLPRWIDLIFGFKSRGEAAMEADNLFHQMAYLGPTELAGMQTEEERFQAELQATEFGIVPDLLFVGPHPLRHEKAESDFISHDIGRASSKDDSTGGREAWELLDPPSHNSQDEGHNMTPLDDQPELENEDGGLSKVTRQLGLAAVLPDPNPGFLGSDTRQSIDSPSSTLRGLPLRGTGEATTPLEERSAAPSSYPMSTPSNQSPRGMAPSPPSPQVQDFAGSKPVSDWDMKIIERKQIHSDAVSGCILLLDEKDERKSILATTSLDGSFKAHKITLDTASFLENERKGFPTTLGRFSYSTILSRGQVSQPSAQSKLTEYRSHSARDPLASLVVASDGADGKVAFAGGHDDVVLAYGINSSCAVASVYSHRDAVTGLDLIERTPFDAECALWLEKSTHIMISGSWDATIKVWSAAVSAGEAVAINREPLAELFDADSSVVCVSATSIPANGIVIGAGCADGSFCVWNVHNDGVQVVVHSERARRGSGPCSVVKWVSEAGQFHMFAAFATGMVSSYSLIDGSLHRNCAVSVGVAVLSMEYTEGKLLVGCSDGGLRLIPIRDGAFFDSKPTLWPAVNNRSSPGICSISIAYSHSEGRRKCICCTGGNDGTVALFELKKQASGSFGY